MRNIIAVFCFFILCAHGCKSPQSDVNPQTDDSQVSALFSGGNQVAEIASTELDEASGLAHSRSNPFYLWSHNDSGGDPTLFLISLDGADSGRYELGGAQNIDWEDLAIGPGPDDGVSYLFAADIGDNRAVRNGLTIYRVAEPDLSVVDLPEVSTLSNVESINFVYEDGARDAEALFVDPATKDIYIITKREPSVILYRLPFPQSTSQENTAERVMVLPYTFITAADISPTGNELLVKNYENVYLWQRTGSQTIQQMLSTPPNRLNYQAEPQGEAIAWATDESGYYTISESDGDPVVIFRYSRN